MCSKLWFLTQDDSIVDVYDDKDIAIEAKIFLREENTQNEIFAHTISFAELASYSDEFDFARERGFLHD